jgi:hypothetical protein
METEHPHGKREELDREPPPIDETEPKEIRAWEQIEAGRYMPRRIRGSCRGRTLG